MPLYGSNLGRSPTRRRSLGGIFLGPAVLAALTAAGLTSGVLGDGIWDVVSWLSLSVPIGVIVFYAFGRAAARLQ